MPFIAHATSESRCNALSSGIERAELDLASRRIVNTAIRADEDCLAGAVERLGLPQHAAEQDAGPAGLAHGAGTPREAGDPRLELCTAVAGALEDDVEGPLTAVRADQRRSGEAGA